MRVCKSMLLSCADVFFGATVLYWILNVAAACQHAPKLANLELLDPSHAPHVCQQLLCHLDQSECSRGYWCEYLGCFNQFHAASWQDPRTLTYSNLKTTYASSKYSKPRCQSCRKVQDKVRKSARHNLPCFDLLSANLGAAGG